MYNSLPRVFYVMATGAVLFNAMFRENDMADWNLGEKDTPAGDMLTDVLNAEHGHLVASSAYSALHSNADDVSDLLEAGDKNSEPADAVCADGGNDSDNDGDDEVRLNREYFFHTDHMTASFFEHHRHRGLLRSACCLRSDALAVSHGRKGSKIHTAHRKHPVYHGHVRIRGRVSVAQ